MGLIFGFTAGDTAQCPQAPYLSLVGVSRVIVYRGAQIAQTRIFTAFCYALITYVMFWLYDW